MKKLLLNLLLIALSTQVSASLISSIENDDDNRYNKILFEIYEDGPVGEVFVSLRTQDDKTDNVLSAQVNLPFFDYDSIFNTEDTVVVKSKKLSYKASGKFKSRSIQFTLNTFQEDGQIWNRTITSILKDDEGYLVSMELYVKVNDFRRHFFNDGLKLNSVTKTRLALAMFEGINSYTIDGELLGTTFTKSALSKLVLNKSFDSIQKYCEENCLTE